MKHLLFQRILCLVLVVLLAAAALAGCAEKTESKPEAGTVAAAPAADNAAKELGEGDKTFYFEVTFSDGGTSSYTIHTDAATVGEALTDQQLISGADTEYGLMVDTVEGEKLDYVADGAYWAFYIDGEYAMTGVDATEITDGATYAFVATPADAG